MGFGTQNELYYFFCGGGRSQFCTPISARPLQDCAIVNAMHILAEEPGYLLLELHSQFLEVQDISTQHDLHLLMHPSHDTALAWIPALALSLHSLSPSVASSLQHFKSLNLKTLFECVPCRAVHHGLRLCHILQEH